MLINIAGSVGLFLLFFFASERGREDDYRSDSDRPKKQQTQEQEEIRVPNEEVEKTNTSLFFGWDVIFERRKGVRYAL